jgi:hypothetical protein
VAALAWLAACTARDEPSPEGITFAEHVAPILAEHCVSCHRPGEPAPFDLSTYRDAERRAQQISEVVQSGLMPPWLPEPGELPFVDERRLSAREVDLVRRWIKEGAPQGDARRLPELPPRATGWPLGEPDLVVGMHEPYTLPAEAKDVFRSFVMPASVAAPRWVRAVALERGNRRVLRHAMLEVDRTPASRRLEAADGEPGFDGSAIGGAEPPDGQLLTWTPGAGVAAGPPGSAWRIEPGDDLVLRLRLRGTGRPEVVRAAVGLYFTDTPPAVRPVLLRVEQPAIDIAAGATDHAVEATAVIPFDAELLALYPDARRLSRTMEITAAPPGARPLTLLRIAAWNPDWQEAYRYATPVPLAAGTTVTLRYTYDNSTRNERNPSRPPVRVVGGRRPTDETAALVLQLVEAAPGAGPPGQAGRYFDGSGT